MMDLLIDLLAVGMIALSLIFYLGGVVGLLRFPDFYTRMHAAGKSDTLSTLLFVGGFAIYYLHDAIPQTAEGEWYKPWLVVIKLFFICAFIMMTSPTSTHALTEAGYGEGIKPDVERDELQDSLKK